MDTTTAAERWATVWARAWPSHDVEAIVGLYADEAVYRSSPFRVPGRGVEAVRSYLWETFPTETDVTCRFGPPIAADGRAAVEWWASWAEGGTTVTLAGTSVLRFDADGLVIDHRDYWNQLDSAEEPYYGW